MVASLPDNIRLNQKCLRLNKHELDDLMSSVSKERGISRASVFTDPQSNQFSGNRDDLNSVSDY